MLYAWFLKIMLLGDDVFLLQLLLGMLQSLHIKYHVTWKTLFDPNFLLFFWIECSQNNEVLKS